MDVDTPGTGTPLSDIAMKLGGVDVVVEKTSAGESGSQIGNVSGDVLRATLVTEISVGGEHTVTEIPMI